MSLSPASLQSRWMRLQFVTAESSAILRPPSRHPSPMSRRTFNALNRSRVRVSPAESPPNSTPAAPRQHKPHDQAASVLICVPASRHRAFSTDRRTHCRPPAALHFRLNPERSARGAVIRSPFSSLSPTHTLHPAYHHLSLIQQQSTSPAPLTGPVQLPHPNSRTINSHPDRNVRPLLAQQKGSTTVGATLYFPCNKKRRR